MSTNDLQLATRYGAEVSLYLLKVSKYFLENPGHQSVTLQLDHSEDEFIAFFEKEARSESYNFWLEPLPYVRLLKKIKIFCNFFCVAIYICILLKSREGNGIIK